MHIFLDNFCQGRKYTAQIASHQTNLRIEEHYTEQKYISITSLQSEYLNFVMGSSFDRNKERADLVQKKRNFCGVANHSTEKCFKLIEKG